MSAADNKLSMAFQSLAGALDDTLLDIYGQPCGFVLVVAPFDQSKTQVQYAANVERADGKALLENLLTRWQQGLPDVPPHHIQ